MPHPYFFCSRTSASATFFLLALLPTLSTAAEPAEAPAPMSMYFDDSQMVEVATRAPKPMTQVAENVSIITAEEIEAMHVHSVAEILSRESGVFIPFSGREIIGDEPVHLLGTHRYQMLMLLDGVRLNLNSNGNVITNFIPVGIIKRIEIIKGPASSAWGSSLGGVVNIITKDTGKSSTPAGNVSVSYGEANTRELTADLAGGNEKAGYYVYAGNINSDGLKNDRYSERDAVYGKMQLKLPHDSTLVASGGYSDPYFKALDWSPSWNPNLNIYDDTSNDNLWGTLYFDTRFTDRLNLHLAVQRYENDFTNDHRSLGTGIGGPKGDLVWMENWKDINTSFDGALNWAGESITANLGVESNRSVMDSKTVNGVLFGSSTTISDPLKEERRGVYTNATFVYGKFTVTPGLRYDYHSNSNEIVSPSLGATYQVADDTLLRTSVARGFSAPYLTAAHDNPGLKPEIIWAYQAGIETFRIPYLTSKLTVFYLNIDDAWQTEPGPTTNNEGKVRRHGVDLDLRTQEFHGLSLRSNFTYSTEDSMGDGLTNLENEETYSANLIFGYRHKPSGIRAELAGNYIWYNVDMMSSTPTPDSDSMLWDAMLSQDFSLPACHGDVFLKAHNIFNGVQRWDVDYPNPERWVEVGAVFKF